MGLVIMKSSSELVDDPNIKYIGFLVYFNAATQKFEKSEPIFFGASKDMKKIFLLDDGEENAIKFENNRLELIDEYWYKLNEGDTYETRDGKAYLNGKEVPMKP